MTFARPPIAAMDNPATEQRRFGFVPGEIPDDEPRLPGPLFWSAMAAGALTSALLIGWLLMAVL